MAPKADPAKKAAQAAKKKEKRKRSQSAKKKAKAEAKKKAGGNAAPAAPFVWIGECDSSEEDVVPEVATRKKGISFSTNDGVNAQYSELGRFLVASCLSSGDKKLIKWLMDTGSPFDLVDKSFLSKKQLKIIYKI